MAAARGIGMAAQDHGTPVSWLVLAPGTAVFSADARDVGAVRHVLGDKEEDIFEGLVLELAGGRHRFATPEEIRGLYEHGVVLRRTASEAAGLPEPRPAPAVMEATGDEPPPGSLERRLQRAWDLISGRG